MTRGGGLCMMQFANEKERDALSDAVSQLLAQVNAKGKGSMGEQNVGTKTKGASPVELAARKSLLHTNKCGGPTSAPRDVVQHQPPAAVQTARNAAYKAHHSRP